MSYTIDLIVKIKKERGISSYRLSKILGVTPQKVSNWETGQSEASARFLLKLMILSNTDPKKALWEIELAHMGTQGAGESMERLERGNARVSLLIVTALLCNPITMRGLSALHCILCKMKRNLVMVSRTRLKIAS